MNSEYDADVLDREIAKLPSEQEQARAYRAVRIAVSARVDSLRKELSQRPPRSSFPYSNVFAAALRPDCEGW